MPDVRIVNLLAFYFWSWICIKDRRQQMFPCSFLNKNQTQEMVLPMRELIHSNPFNF